MTPAAGWYADPENPGKVRWWDGNVWTEHRQLTPLPEADASPVAWRPSPPEVWIPPRKQSSISVVLIVLAAVAAFVVLLVGVVVVIRAGTKATLSPYSNIASTTDSAAQQQLAQAESSSRAYLANNTDFTTYDPTADVGAGLSFVPHNVRSTTTNGASTISWNTSSTAVTFADMGTTTCFFTAVSADGMTTRTATAHATSCTADNAPGRGTWTSPAWMRSSKP